MPKKPKPLPLRLFVGVKFPLLKQIKPLLDDISSLAEDKSLKLRISPTANLHLTLKYLGTVSEEQGVPIQSVLAQVGHQLQSFKVNCSSVGFFKNSLWVGVEKNERLKELVDELNQGLAVLDFEVETKEFSPHITLAKFDKSAKEKLLPIAEKYQETVWGEIEVNKFHLYKSHTLSEGAKYFILSKYEMGTPN
ncbi:MAG: RNA 2',3'-cyclic phosphodiesterase [Pseudohongiellaceae bacterium]